MTVTALNGQLPARMLTVADTGVFGAQRLRIDAAASWDRMIAAGMPAGCLRSGYRTRAQQAALDPGVAAPVGQSQHGEGLAADVDEPARTWIKRNGLAYGWRIGFVPNEPWHTQYDRPDKHAHAAPAPQPATAPTEDADMLTIIRTAQHGIYTVAPGCVVAHVSDAVSKSLEYLGKATIIDVAPDDLVPFIYALTGCPKASIPPPGYAWSITATITR